MAFDFRQAFREECAVNRQERLPGLVAEKDAGAMVAPNDSRG